MARRAANGMEYESLRQQDVERRLRALESAARLPDSAIGERGLRFHSGGGIRVENSSGQVIVTLDTDGLKVEGSSVEPPPVGSVFAFGGSSAPTGYLLCQGQAVSRTTFSNLFAVIGTTYGNGNGSTTFNVPDLRQRFPLGQAASGTGSTLGGTGGDINHTHSGPSHTHSTPNHNHDLGNSATDGGGGGTSTDEHNHSFSSGFTTGGPTGTVSRESGSFTGPSNAHTHTGSVSGTTGNDTHGHTIPNHQHDLGNSVTDGGGTSGSGGTGNTGTGNPPFLVLNFVIKR